MKDSVSIHLQFGTGWPSTALPHLVQDGERSLTVQHGERSLRVNPRVGLRRWRPRPVGVCRTGEPEHQQGTGDQYRSGECDNVPDGDRECGDRGSFRRGVSGATGGLFVAAVKLVPINRIVQFGVVRLLRVGRACGTTATALRHQPNADSSREQVQDDLEENE